MTPDREAESRRIDALDDLLDVVGYRYEVPCQLPDRSVVDVEACRDWLQDSARDGYHVRVEAGWVGLRRGVVVHRWLGGEAGR